MVLVMSGSVRPTGGFSMSSFVGNSVARAKAPRVSMTKFIHSKGRAVNGTSLSKIAATMLTTRAERFAVSWYWMNFWMLLYTNLPHLKTVGTEVKLSMTMSEHSLATSVPWIPMNSPTSASFSAGASLVPSP
ncbi:hypothetical protein TorRG33x02_018520, partial [Trema orientale]